eukprot:15216-Pelagomonas_calceolata.AAC.3
MAKYCIDLSEVDDLVASAKAAGKQGIPDNLSIRQSDGSARDQRRGTDKYMRICGHTHTHTHTHTHLGCQGSAKPGLRIALQVAASTPWDASHSLVLEGMAGSSGEAHECVERAHAWIEAPLPRRLRRHHGGRVLGEIPRNKWRQKQHPKIPQGTVKLSTSCKEFEAAALCYSSSFALPLTVHNEHPAHKCRL